ncbi:MAG: hypothetical protein QOG52_179 [Frankiaceae bacterium]|nr:hypothetical protein [Frankiaceae bacterium]
MLLALVTLLAFAQVAAPASATSYVAGVRLNAYEARLVQLVNQARADNGLRPVVVTAGATDVARRWAWQQAGSDRMSHNPAFASDLAAAGGRSWTWAAENVGFGNAADPDQLFDLYMHSPLHRANILSPRAKYIGMGVVPHLVGSWLMAYNTMNFNDSYTTTYGPSRTPAAALPLDGDALPTTSYVATFDGGLDQRVGAVAYGRMATSSPRTDSPGPGDGAVRWTVHSSSARASGYADLELRQAMDLTAATTMTLRLQVDTRGVAHVPVTVWVARYGGDTVQIGQADVTRYRNDYSFTLPDAARDYRDTVIVRVPAASVVNIAPTKPDIAVRLSLYAIRVG